MTRVSRLEFHTEGRTTSWRGTIRLHDASPAELRDRLAAATPSNAFLLRCARFPNNAPDASWHDESDPRDTDNR